VPLYSYRCEACGKEFDQVNSCGCSEKISCPGCGSENVKKVFSPFSFLRPNSGSSESPRPRRRYG